MRILLLPVACYVALVLHWEFLKVKMGLPARENSTNKNLNRVLHRQLLELMMMRRSLVVTVVAIPTANSTQPTNAVELLVLAFLRSVRA